MVRWVRTWLTTMLWSFATAGALGLAEALSQWVRFGPPEGAPESGFVAAVLPPFALYGWLGLVTAGAVFWPAAIVTRWRPRPRRAAFGLALGAALGLILTVYFGYLILETSVEAAWRGTGMPVLVLKVLFFAVAAWGCVRLALWGADRSCSRPAQWIFVPVLLLVVTSAQWPSWREMRVSTRTSDLERVAGVPGEDAHNLLLVSIDALRVDHVGCLSPSAPPTPNLDAQARRSILYPNAWGVSSWTLPNVATDLTGLPPRTLGVGRGAGLPDGVPTLAEVAWSHGWSTGAVITNPFLGVDFGFQRGFETFDHSDVLESLEPADRSVLARELTRYWTANTSPDDASRIVWRALTWLDTREDDRPFFLWLHFLDPHLPYRWHAFPDDPPGATIPRHALIDDDAFRALHEVREELPNLDPALEEGIRELYRREVRYVDGWLGRLLEGLEDRGLDQETVVVVLSDHGEEFFEHGGFEHGHTLMPEVTRIPLMVAVPGREPGVHDDPVTTLDLVPSLCRELGWAAPSGLPGRSGLWDGGAVTELTLLENMLYGPEQQGLWAWPLFRVDAEGAPRWFDLGTDPAALRPMAAPPALADSLAGRAEALTEAWDENALDLRPDGVPDRTELSDHTRRRLESLGY